MTDRTHIEINIAEQTLRLFAGERCLQTYPVSTARNGVGEQQDSFCTPRGKHVIAEKIGAGCVPGTVFVGRQPTGETYSPALRQAAPDRDWILTRILWLDGQQEGYNRGGEVDSRRRYIYIHGTPDDVELGVPGSRGCIRMRNSDIIELFEQVKVNTPVVIRES